MCNVNVRMAVFTVRLHKMGVQSLAHVCCTELMPEVCNMFVHVLSSDCAFSMV